MLRILLILKGPLIGAVAAMSWLHAALLWGGFEYARDLETSVILFLVTPSVALAAAAGVVVFQGD